MVCIQVQCNIDKGRRKLQLKLLKFHFNAVRVVTQNMWDVHTELKNKFSILSVGGAMAVLSM